MARCRFETLAGRPDCDPRVTTDVSGLRPKPRLAIFHVYLATEEPGRLLPVLEKQVQMNR